MLKFSVCRVVVQSVLLAITQTCWLWAEHRLPQKFVPLDTSCLLGSPDPIPLEAAKAFPNLQFERPVELTCPKDGSDRIFVIEQRGVIHVFPNQADVDKTEEFLDLRDVVLREGNEEGLLGLALHPRFQQNGEFFVYYSTKPRSSVISRFKVSKDNPQRADRQSEEKLLTIKQPYENHNGGSLRFGPEGFLYIGLGDGGLRDDPHNNGQNLATLLGSILRIDVDRRDADLPYAIPADNPFVGRRDARAEIWAYGFRNVWRLTFDETGQLWAGDVGQDRFEEINLIRRGGNYGWNFREGLHDFQSPAAAKPESLIDPVVEYFRGQGQSVTGGVVYRGPTLREYEGAYFYGDFQSGNVWALRASQGKLVENRQVARTDLKIAAFGEDQHKEMYLCAFDGFIYRLRKRPIDLEATAKSFPRNLSQTGLYASVADNEPAAGLIPYEVNLPFWSDYAVKDRYIALPKAGGVVFDEHEKWKFPRGTVFVKTFWMHRDRARLKDPVRLETRLLVHADEGWVGYTYVYNANQTDAELLDSWLTRPIEVQTEDGKIDQHYYFPSRADCLTCHTKAEGFVLGLTTRQMNRELRYRGEAVNQISLLARLGVFDEKPARDPERLERFPDWGFGNLRRDGANTSEDSREPKGDATKLARAWLEVNCAMCHRPEGIAAVELDLRSDIALEKMNLVGKSPKQSRAYAPGTLLIDPGKPHASELLRRIGQRGPRQMPPVGSYSIDPAGYEVIRQWVTSDEMRPQR